MEKLPLQQDLSSVGLDTAVALSFDYLKQLGTIAMTAAGGLIALAQFVEGDKRFFIKIMIATSLMFMAALLAFFAQYSLVDRIRQAHDLLRRSEQKTHSHEKVRRMENLFESAALWLLSISMGVALQALFTFG